MSNRPTNRFDDEGELYEWIEGAVQRDPRTVLATTRTLTTNETPRPLRAVALWGVGRSEFELGQLPQAISTLRRARSLAGPSGATLSTVTISLAHALAEHGRPREAARELARIDENVAPSMRGRYLAQVAVVHLHAGNFTATIEAATRAIAHAGSRDSLTRMRSFANRSIAHMGRGDFAGARRDAGSALRIADHLGQRLASAVIVHNAALVEARAGFLVDGLTLFDDARRRLEELGSPPRIVANLERDLAEMLWMAGHYGDAARAALRAEDLADRLEHLGAAGEAGLLAALAYEHLELYSDATQCARRSIGRFRRAGRPGWAAFASLVALRIDGRSTDIADPALLRRRVSEVRRQLHHHGWDAEAVQAQALLIEIRLATGDVRRAHAELQRLPVRGQPILRLTRFAMAARVRQAAGDDRGARVAVRQATTLVDRLSANVPLGLQPWSLARSKAMTDLATSLALQSGDPLAVLRWADLARGVGVQPGADADLRRRPERRRASPGAQRSAAPVGSVLERSARFGRAGAAEPVDRAEVAISQALEPGVGASLQRRFLDTGRLAETVGDRQLLEFVIDRERLLAVVIGARRPPALVEIGAIADLRIGLEAAQRLILRSQRVQSQVTELDGIAPLTALSERLDHLLEPSAPGVVVVPTDVLHRLPWNVLPVFRERNVVVAASASMWMSDRASQGRGTRFIAGPGLPGAAREVELLGAKRNVSGREATIAETLAAAESCRVLHIAAHGRFASQRPHNSGLQLADGLLTVDMVQQLHAVPEVVVLSACDSGRATVIGDEVVGLAHTFLGLGVRTVIAPVLSVPDASTVDLMVDLHRRLRRGEPARIALARSVRAASDPSARLFTCFGNHQS